MTLSRRLQQLEQLQTVGSLKSQPRRVDFGQEKWTVEGSGERAGGARVWVGETQTAVRAVRTREA